MSEVRVNVEYKSIFPQTWKDSENRSQHVIDRMQLRGIGINNIKEAVNLGAKTLREDGSVVARHKWYAVIYREFDLPTFKKIYPITVLLKK